MFDNFEISLYEYSPIVCKMKLTTDYCLKRRLQLQPAGGSVFLRKENELTRALNSETYYKTEGRTGSCLIILLSYFFALWICQKAVRYFAKNEAGDSLIREFYIQKITQVYTAVHCDECFYVPVHGGGRLLYR